MLCWIETFASLIPLDILVHSRSVARPPYLALYEYSLNDTLLTAVAVQAMETISRVVQYVESHLHRMSSNSLPDGDILNLVGGDGGVQVDVVFYMVSNRKRPLPSLPLINSDN